MNGIPSLGAFQNGFAHTLASDSAAPVLSGLLRQPGFAVYRNMVMKGCIDALQANFPAVARLTGEEWFRGAAAEYVRKHFPHDARLLLYGEDFPDYLAHFSPAAELAYLPGVARLDRYWIECHASPDDDAQQPDGLLAVAGEALGACVLRPRASARWQWFDGLPVHSIWRVNREQTPISDELAWTGEGALLVRHGGAVHVGHCRQDVLFAKTCIPIHSEFMYWRSGSMLIFQIGVAESFAEANAQRQTLPLGSWDALEITDFLSPPDFLTNRR